MIVDDSLTVRRITSRLLAREGFGRAHGQGRHRRPRAPRERGGAPDVILLDIEMPRMDGFEFTKTIKANPKHASIPIVMITSRTAEKHRNLAKGPGCRSLSRQAVPGGRVAAAPARHAGADAVVEPARPRGP
jgi:chemosensory pili system protein ChpA (sensor histidine kinase/response regulator)